MGRLLSATQEIIGEKIFRHLVKFMGDVKFSRTITACSPVASELSWGSSHTHIETLVDAANPTDTSDTIVTVINVPPGTKAIAGYARVISATTAGRELFIKDSDGNVWCSFRNPTTAIRGIGWFEVPLNASKQFLYAANNADINEVDIYIRKYFI